MFQLKVIFEVLSPDYLSTILNSTSEFSFCWLDWVLVVAIASSLLDFRLSTRKNGRWKSEIWRDLATCVLPRTHLRSPPEVRIQYLLLFQFGLFGYSKALFMLAHESSWHISIVVNYLVDFLSTRSSADIVAIDYKCICSVECPSLLSASW